MMRSMFAAISGLKSHQIMMDVTANDIANVNTIGYKSSRTTFKDSLATSQRQSQSLALLGKTVNYTAADGTAMSGLVKKVDFGSDGTVHLTIDGGTTITPSDVSGVQ